MLREPGLAGRLAERRGGVVLFGMTPPRVGTPPERVREVAVRTVERLAGLDLDGLVLYDIDDESDRNPEERPFPFSSTLDPAGFASELEGWERPVVIYRCVGKYDEADLAGWLARQDPERVLTVFVGASSREKPVRTSLTRAQELRAEVGPEVLLGAVAIPERHVDRGGEHARLLAKQSRGCDFFVSQVVYDVNAAKDLLSDYAYACRDEGVDPVPLVFTLSVCGSARTLDFLQWLGVKVPRWMQNELRHTDDTLAESFDQCLATAAELTAYAARLGAPIGFNVESVSVRRAEIEASVELAARVRELLPRT
ncbi:methylenetetrahydrofolate reductase [Nocardioides solisilvae]|uniref:methylenetetrahydrofolate reductase n=1 Tax=Nocardioides solisilvae TaxID=1542435 RepID=UPI001EF41F33|nr:methylenetetrahydrofolate reductase [Nocardioides solisilvae]